MNKNKPVLLMRQMILFPSSEIRLEIEDEIDKKLLKMSSNFYDDELVLVNLVDKLEEDPDTDELPDFACLGKIKMKIDMPNGKTRVVIEGVKRVKITNYLKEDKIIIAQTKDIIYDDLEMKENLAYIKTLIKKTEEYVREVPYISNTIIEKIAGINDLEILSDIITLFLPIEYERKLEYLEESSVKTRVKMILKDIEKDLEIINLEKKIEEEVEKSMENTQKEFILKEKLKVIQEELGESDNDFNSLEERLEKLKAPKRIKERINKEINRYKSFNSYSPEMSMLYSYIDWMLSLPWEIRTKDERNLEKVKEKLDETHQGLDKVKMRIIEFLAVKEKKNSLRSPIICLVGPPGVGKTTLARSIAKALNRNEAKISVGGVNDEAEIIGHRRTYVGSLPGLIIQGMKRTGSKNPVFIIDEIDKMTKDIKGDPASALLEVLDQEMNKSFQDHYIEEEFDLSEVLFIATANYLEQIPNELRDRLEIVEISSYTEYEKLDIAKNHLIPHLFEEHGLLKKEVKLKDEVILKIIRNYTKESGVRELERQISTILRKIVTEMVLEKTDKVYNLKISDIEKYLGKEKYQYNDIGKEEYIGLVNGLAYTPFGGDILPIEANMYKGKGDILLTGSLGDVLKESAKIAISYIKANSKKFGIKEDILKDMDLHINVPEAATPKDGPSAGVALTTTLISLFKKEKIKNDIAMTGEITLRGNVLAIGGLKEKLIGADRAGMKKIFIPKENKKDLDEVPKEVLDNLEIILVDKYEEIFKNL